MFPRLQPLSQPIRPVCHCCPLSNDNDVQLVRHQRREDDERLDRKDEWVLSKPVKNHEHCVRAIRRSLDGVDPKLRELLFDGLLTLIAEFVGSCKSPEMGNKAGLRLFLSPAGDTSSQPTATHRPRPPLPPVTDPRVQLGTTAQEWQLLFVVLECRRCTAKLF